MMLGWLRSMDTAMWKVKPPCLLVAQLCRSLMCAARSQLSETLMSEEGSSKSVRQRGKLGKRGQRKIPFGVSLSPCRLPLILQSPSHLSLFIASYLAPDPFHSLRALFILSLSHARAFKQASAHPAAIRRDSESASISRLVSIWHRASRPVRHSPVPPHSALLVTPDNWRRNPKFRRGRRGDRRLTWGLALNRAGDIKGCF